MKEKRRLFGEMQKLKQRKVDRRRKPWKDAKGNYERSKKEAKKVIGRAKEAERVKWGQSLDRADEEGRVFKVVKQMVRRNTDIVGGGSIRNKEGRIVVGKDEMKEVWRGYYERLMNEEFDCNREGLVEVEEERRGEEEESDKIVFSNEEVREAIMRMKEEKAAGPTGVVAEMFKAMGEEGVRRMTDLCNEVVKEGKIPEDWSRSWMVSIYKGKGDALECGSYRGVKLLEHGLKVFERVVEARLRRDIMEGRISIDAMHFGFMPGRGTTDAVFVVRQLQEKYLQKRRELWMAFVDLEKAFDRVPREVLWWALRRLGVEKGMIRLIKAMYAGSTTAVKVQGEGTESFEVKVGVHQGSVLSPLLFVMVMEALSRDCREGLPYELLYADDLVLMAESREGLGEKLGAWKKSLEAKGLRVNISKTKVMKCQVGLGHHMAASAKDPCGVCGRRVALIQRDVGSVRSGCTRDVPGSKEN